MLLRISHHRHGCSTAHELLSRIGLKRVCPGPCLAASQGVLVSTYFLPSKHLSRKVVDQLYSLGPVWSLGPSGPLGHNPAPAPITWKDTAVPLPSLSATVGDRTGSSMHVHAVLRACSGCSGELREPRVSRG